MMNVKLTVSSLMVSDYKNDELIRCMYNTESDDPDTALSAYMRICEILYASRQTLSGYIFTMACDKGGTLFDSLISDDSRKYESVLKRECDLLASLASVTSEDLITRIQGKSGADSEIELPLFETGSTVISVDSVVSFHRKYGSVFFRDNKAFIYENGRLLPVKRFDRIALSDLKNYDTQRNAVINNTRCFLGGQKHNNILLYGDRGTGKSATVKAVVNEYPELRIVLVPKSSVMQLYDIYDLLGSVPLKFILFIDDISFSDSDPEFGFMKQALEGSVSVLPDNCMICATTNRRHIIRETAYGIGNENHEADARDEISSLADRFGLYLTFFQPDKNGYLDIVRKIAGDRNIDIPDNRLSALAERFSLRKANRSPRTARQFCDMVEARLALGIDLENI